MMKHEQVELCRIFKDRKFAAENQIIPKVPDNV